MDVDGIYMYIVQNRMYLIDISFVIIKENGVPITIKH